MTTKTTPTPATPLKLRSGEWGARSTSEDTAAGDLLLITTRAGKTWKAKVVRVLWCGDGAAICQTERVAGTTRPGSYKRTRRAPSYDSDADPGSSRTVYRRITEDDASLYGSQYLGREGQMARMPA